MFILVFEVKKTGIVVDITSLYDLEIAGAISGSTALFFDDNNGKFDRINSQDCFNQRTHANEMLNGLRYFERGSKEGSRYRVRYAFEIVDLIRWTRIERSIYMGKSRYVSYGSMSAGLMQTDLCNFFERRSSITYFIRLLHL